MSSTDGVGHEDRDRRGAGPLRHDRHRPRRDVRRRRRLHAAPSRSRSSTTSPSGASTRANVAELVARRRGGLPAGRLRARRRRDGRAPGPDGARRVRPRRLLHRDRRARRGSSTGRRPGPATRSSGSPRPASTRTATRSCARSSPSTTSTCAAPYQALLRRVLGDAEAGAAARARAGPRARDAGRRAAHADAHLRPRRARDPRGARGGRRTSVRGIAHVTGGGLPGNVPRALPAPLGARLDPSAWPMPSVMRLLGALGGDRGRRAARDVQRRPRAWSLVVPAAAGAADRRAGARPWHRRLGRGRGRRRAALGRRAVRGGAPRERAGRGSRSACPGPARTCGRSSRSAARGALGGEVALVFADRPCPALDWAAEQGIETVLVPGGDDATLADDAGRRRARRRRPRGLPAARRPGGAARAFAGRILNVHPSLLPAFPGLHAVRDALAAGVAVTGVTVHLVDATLDGGPIVAQEAVPVLPDDDEATLLERIHAVEHRLLPAAVARLLAGALSVAPGARRARLDAGGRRRRARRSRAGRCCRSPTRRASRTSAAGSSPAASSSSAPGGTARALREAGLPVTDVAAVTGFPEMLDGRVKTLHPRVHAGLLADRRRADHREALAAAGIAPFDLVVVNLYPFAEAARRPGISFDELVEEIDIGGPSMVRAAAKNHASVAIVTSPARYDAVLAALDEHGEVPLGLRSALAVEAFAHTAAYDARIAAELPCRMRDAGDRPARRSPGCPGAGGPVPAGPHDLDGEGRDAALRREPAPAGGALPAHGPRAARRATGPFAGGEPPLQGKALSYNNVLDASAAAALARLLRGPGRRHRQAHQPVRRRRAPDAARGLGRGARRRPGVGVRRRRRDHRAPWTAPLAERLASIFLEVVVAPAFDDGALEVLATKPNLRLVVDPVARRVGRPRRAHRRAACSTSTAGLAADRRWRGARHGARHAARRPGGLATVSRRAADRPRAARPRPRLAPVPGRRLERDRPRPRRRCSSGSGRGR